MDHLELINNFIESLPYLEKDQVPEDLCCPICLVSFQDIFEDTSNDEKVDEGVTQLPCLHTFCRKEYVFYLILLRMLLLPTC